MIRNRKADRIYIGLIKAINKNGGVECEQYPEIYIPSDDVDGRTIYEDYKFTRMICGRCPVKGMCAEYAIESKQTHGMWGGLTPREISKEFTRRYKNVIPRGRPRLDFTLASDGDEERPAEKSWSQSDLGSLHLSPSEGAEWAEGDPEQVLAWGQDWDSDAPLY